LPAGKGICAQDKRGLSAGKQGLVPAQITLAWLLQKPGVVAPIVGASKSHQLDDALAALKIRLTSEAIATLEGAYLPHPVAGM
jgi:aryl-alcohol dehydrogenase-like predicted oxidoreductase